MTKVAGFQPESIRNIVLLGHAGSGKTTLAEAVLHRCGAITRMGSVDAATTISDFEPEAKQHHHSTNSTLLFATCEGREVNMIDTPGSPELVGHALAALPAVETAVIVVNASAGVELGTRRLFHAAGEAGLARMIVVNRIDENLAGLPALVESLRAALGPELHCINLPTRKGEDVIDCFDQDAGPSDFGSVAEVHKEMLESTIEVDDATLERYLGGETIRLPELRQDFVVAMNRGHVVPILFTSATKEVGIDDLLHILVEEAPSPQSGRPRRLRKGQAGELIDVSCDAKKPFLAHVFKITTDPYLGKLSMLRILQGSLDGNTQFVCGPSKKVMKAGHILKVEGRDHPELSTTAFAGDLVAIAKLDDLHVDMILRDPAVDDDWAPARPPYPTPMYALAVDLKNKADEVKLSSALQRLVEEDPTLRAVQDPQTHELVLSGIGELHLRVTMEKLKNRFNLEVVARQPTIAYKETITGRSEGHFRLKKQTGGAGQFAEVFLRVEPLPRGNGYEFVDEVYGGAIPHNFIPACDKGCQDALERGVVAGFPANDVRVTLTDGKSHSVDSKDASFRTAAKFAMRDAMSRANPVLLEPIVTLEITVPERHVGDITGDLKNKRGHVVGVEVGGAGMVVVRAQAPLAELGRYAGQLRSFTGGQGSFVMELSHYDVVPHAVQQKVAAERKPHAAAEE
ncbi:MAG TPA: elongation factor G [Kofleriaceae bacterium]|jgi:elongation factor G|nr:elongation factor G [Kofleriaceae bacterium]